ncbi:hypothetical protein ACI01nite_22950 [Acetobacter cibinongensis]|uniref:Uncharacterized protein n=1 Tax=Acetobacter cibinongensis TaxID=146475 RepID=A0A0D6N7D3_9PROT|nr:hypothetical protein Abci_019_015 [Acetobacter cibinongensis]GBQ14135.1 hypothetical protein AA0482_0809 [Acetobacter cibinongensis NRIC 0482]GEL59693.1 hypothetical protein ACI01nite_22950 [Acetobacter cibinongensis]
MPHAPCPGGNVLTYIKNGTALCCGGARTGGIGDKLRQFFEPCCHVTLRNRLLRHLKLCPALGDMRHKVWWQVP